MKVDSQVATRTINLFHHVPFSLGPERPALLHRSSSSPRMQVDRVRVTFTLVVNARCDLMNTHAAVGEGSLHRQPCAQRIKMSIRVLSRGMGKKMAAVPSGELMIVLQIGMLENKERMSGCTIRTPSLKCGDKALPTAIATSISRTTRLDSVTVTGTLFTRIGESTNLGHTCLTLLMFPQVLTSL